MTTPVTIVCAEPGPFKPTAHDGKPTPQLLTVVFEGRLDGVRDINRVLNGVRLPALCNSYRNHEKNFLRNFPAKSTA